MSAHFHNQELGASTSSVSLQNMATTGGREASGSNSILTASSGNHTSYGSQAADSPSTSNFINIDDEAPLIHSPMIWRLPRAVSMVAPTRALTDSRRTLGTFAGVFCPIALSMFSTMLFLRTGFVVGQAGLLETILMLILAYIILVLTVFSICAISTNGAVEGGGAYYMISRALGPEFGGSIGFLFYVANVLACALYVSGFVEGIIQNFGIGGSFVSGDAGLPVAGQWWKYLYATVVLFLCLLVCMVGGSMFAKTLTVILGITVVCLLSVIISIFAKTHRFSVDLPKENHLVVHHTDLNSTNVTQFFYTGLSAATFRSNLYPGYERDYSQCQEPDSKDSSCNVLTFGAVFAILFSSVTGIMNGANMSGELKDPSKSIPKGTLSAVAFTFTSYLILCVLIAGSNERGLLINNYIFLQGINLWHPFVLIGIFATTLSAALGNLIGASRILEALANDQLFWFVLNPATKTTKGGNPFVAVLITWVLVQLVLLIGSLNAIAPATSVFFLLAYASTNLACMALDLASAPNFRPTFRYFSWHTSLLGLIGSMVMCFLISPLYSSIAIIIMLILIILLHFRSLPTGWGSISQALIFHQVRKYLLMLDIRKEHVKYWRPQILLLVAKVRQSAELIDFINDIKKGGLYVIGNVRLGTLDDYKDKDPLIDELPKWMRLVDKLRIKAFVELTLARTVPEGLHHLIRLSGLGGMKPNTVCLGFYDNNKPVDSLANKRVKKKTLFKTVETDKYFEVVDKFGGIRDEDENKKDIRPHEYVRMIADCLKMSKNVMLCRHFTSLNKSNILNAKGTLFIDVWPINFFRPETASYFDNTCLFILQLATVINMVPGWKSKTCLRVFMFANSTENSTMKKQKLQRYLLELRIPAEIQIVSWESLPLEIVKREFDESVNYPESRMQEYNEVSDEFLTAVNTMIMSYSSRTVLSFFYLPRPPHDTKLHQKYLSQLDGLTVELPPSIFVHGLHPVTSTTL